MTLISKKTKTFTKNKPVKSTDYKTRLPDATFDGSISQNTDEIIVKGMFCSDILNFWKTLWKIKKTQILTDTFADGGPTQRAVTFELLQALKK